MESTIAYIALGSNLGERAATLVQAAKTLNNVRGVKVRRISNMIETEPAGPEDQPKYLNAATEIQTTLSPQELLHTLQDIERKLGRDRSTEQRWGPRTCDLDILLMGNFKIETQELTIPHPRMHERIFVLKPLASIAPNVRHPLLDKTVVELLAEIEAGK